VAYSGFLLLYSFIQPNSVDLAFYYYLCRVNEVNGGGNVFIGLCVCLCVRSEPVNLTVGMLNANGSKTVKATDFKLDRRISRVSLDMIHLTFMERGAARVSNTTLGGNMHSH